MHHSRWLHTENDASADFEVQVIVLISKVSTRVFSSTHAALQHPIQDSMLYKKALLCIGVCNFLLTTIFITPSCSGSTIGFLTTIFLPLIVKFYS
jgi:hypothetical protein